ncbi:MAG: hypothetical protein JNG86_20640 [Verrucomicrobiaceae bacterium]|nr:hypothetical protein [Verrucomicrobiaceae bacterium]
MTKIPAILCVVSVLASLSVPAPAADGGEVSTLNTLPPVATTGGAMALGTTWVQVLGTVRANNASTSVFFDYGMDGLNFPHSLAATPASVSGDADIGVSADLTDLSQFAPYYYRLRAVSSVGTTVGLTHTFQVQLLSDLSQQYPSAPPSSEGFWMVNLAPADILHGWRFVGEQQWRPSGLPVAGLTTSDREIEFRPVPGYIQPPQEPISVASGEAATVVNLQYYVTPVPGTGQLSVTLKPDSLTTGIGRAQWRLVGEDDTQWRDSGAALTGLLLGSYLVECKPVTGRATPPNVNVTIINGQSSTPVITYYPADSQTGTPPSALSFASVSTDTTKPFAYVGQLRSNMGSSSGFVVKERVVATAAHVVFDDGTLSAVQGLQWLFQQHRGLHEPAPIVPRGFCFFDSYAAQRQMENTPGDFSPQSQNLDVAAIYFNQAAGRGGYGGFLASDLTSNEFLLSGANKMLIGYPVDGIAATSQGRMHATPPFNVVFNAAYGRTFTTNGIRSSSGNSGGPLCVQHTNGSYYPAAIYLGGSGQTVVRAIDSEVIELIQLAQISSFGGWSAPGGGHIPITNPPITPNIGALRVNIEPAGAVAAGAAWRLSPESAYRASGTQKFGLNEGTYILQMLAVPGYEVPSPQSFTVTAGQFTILTYSYAPATTPQESWRQTYFGSTANSGNAADTFDFDGDGFTNAQEYAAGTNPTLSGDFFKVTDSQRTASTFTASTAGKAGRTYTLQRSVNLTSWTAVGSPQGPLASDGAVTLQDAAMPNDAAFYRIVVTGP